MARDIIEIAASIEAEKNAKPELAALNSPSAVSLWKLIKDTIAFVMWVLEKLWDQFRVEVDQLADAAWHGSESWWIAKAKEFQMGDVLEVVNYAPLYPVTVPETDPKRVVKFAAITETSFGGALLKVAGAGNGNFAALTGPQKDAFITYAKQLQPPGAKITVISENPDEIKVFGSVYYNAQYDLTTIQLQVNEALQTYRQQFTNSGELIHSKVMDAIQSVPGVKDVYQLKIDARPNGGVWSTVQRKYQTYAGYATITTQLTYLPE